MAYKVVHYINQFFAGIGGEEKADIAPEVREGKVGPGMGLGQLLAPDAEIVATFICGDNYFATNSDKVCQEVIDCCKKYKADALIAGPAFNAGRYGTACASVCAAVQKELGIPTLTALYKENPGVDLSARKSSLSRPPILRAAWARPCRQWQPLPKSFFPARLLKIRQPKACFRKAFARICSIPNPAPNAP